MLISLEIRDMVIVDHLLLDFGTGLTALTGETGAGKSILLDCLGFVLGGRGRGQALRGSAELGEVTAVFSLRADHPVRARLAEIGVDETEDELIFRRQLRADGRKTGFVNDRRVSGAVMAELGAYLVEVQGQGDEHGLMNPATHRAALDAFGGHGPLLAELSDQWRAWQGAAQAVERLEAAQAQAASEQDFLTHAMAELAELAPEPGEEERLDAERRRMRAAAETGEDLQRAAHALEVEAEGACAAALRWLQKGEAQLEGALSPVMAALERAMVELGEARGALADTMDHLSFDPLVLETTEERLFALRRLARKHQVVADDLPALAERIAADLAAFADDGKALEAERQAAAQAEAAYHDTAARLRAAREAAAGRLDQAIAAEMGPLKLGRARFATVLRPVEPGPHGADHVAFEVSVSPGTPAGPLGKVASGGERARFLLALKIALAEANASGPVMIFDEIDRGVGGATADAVGRRLQKLAGTGQVLAVTHSPQVAACADQHWQVRKSVQEGQTLSRVVPLVETERVQELARMLAGDTITQAAENAALALLEQAKRPDEAGAE